jgi:hypothetical protein
VLPSRHPYCGSFSQLLTLARRPTIKDKSRQIEIVYSVEAIGKNHLSVQSVQSVTDSPTRALAHSLPPCSPLLRFYSSSLHPNSSLLSSFLLNTSPPSRTYITYLLLLLLRPANLLPFFCIFSFVDNKHPLILSAHPHHQISCFYFIHHHRHSLRILTSNRDTNTWNLDTGYNC